MRTATFSDSLLCCGLAETHCRKAWRSICRKNDISERRWASKKAINGHDHIQKDIPLPGKGRSARGRAGVADSQRGWFVSPLECYSSSRATTEYWEKAAKRWRTSSDTAPSCQTWLRGEEDASKSGLLLRAPFVVEPLQTISS